MSSQLEKGQGDQDRRDDGRYDEGPSPLSYTMVAHSSSVGRSLIMCWSLLPHATTASSSRGLSMWREAATKVDAVTAGTIMDGRSSLMLMVALPLCVRLHLLHVVIT